MGFIDEIKNRAKTQIKTIVLPEASDKRIMEAASIVLREEYANIILLGDEKKLKQMAQENDFDLSKATMINPKTSEKLEQYANDLYELRKNKGMTIEKAKELVLDEVYFGMMMVKKEEADGLVSRSDSFDFRYASSRPSNSENSTRYKIGFRLFCYGCAKL